MAYFTQEMKKEIEPEIKELLKEFNLKGSLSVKDFCKVYLKIKEGFIDFGRGDFALLGYYENLDSYKFNETANNFLRKAFEILNFKNYDNSDIDKDYFEIGYFVEVKVGSWDKPCKLITEQAAQQKGS